MYNKQLNKYNKQLNKYNMNNESQNGNSQLNSERSNFNRKVCSLRMMGQSKKVIWDGRRRFRTI